MNSNLAPNDPGIGDGNHQLRTMLTVGVSIIGLMMILLCPTTVYAQSGSCGNSYTVRSGDTINGIASRHGTSASRIRTCNNLPSDAVRRGQQIQVPGQESSSSENRSRYNRDGTSGGPSGTNPQSASPSGSDRGNENQGTDNSSSSSSDSKERKPNKAQRKR